MSILGSMRQAAKTSTSRAMAGNVVKKTAFGIGGGAALMTAGALLPERGGNVGMSMALGGMKGLAVVGGGALAASSMLAGITGGAKAGLVGAGIGAAVGAVAGGIAGGIFQHGMSPFQRKLSERGRAPSKFTGAMSAMAGIGVGTAVGGGILAGTAIGSKFGPIAGAAGGIVSGALIAAGVMATGVGLTAKGLHTAIKGTQQQRMQDGVQIRGSYNNSRRDATSSKNLVQSLHKVRHKRVL